VSDPQVRWAQPVLDRLELRGDERVLDAGCGTGRVTEQLLERLPRGAVVALDADPEMVAAARKRLGRSRRVQFVVANLLEPLPVDPVDAVFSTAAFHWVKNHDRLFRNIAGVLKPGGQLVAQFGAEGNVASFLRVMDELGELESSPWLFPSVEETEDPVRNARRHGRVHPHLLPRAMAGA
jgi:trans-aconitate 2-methyltransferase